MSRERTPEVGRLERRRRSVPAVTEARHGTVRVLHVAGDLDPAGAGELRAAVTDLLAARPAELSTLVVDLSAVGLLGAAGLAAVDTARRGCRDVLGMCVVAAGPVLRSLRVSGIAEDLDVYASVERALAVYRVDRPKPSPEPPDLAAQVTVLPAPTPLSPDRSALAGLPEYLRQVATAVGTDPTHVDVAARGPAATAYLALDQGLTSFPDLALALLWDEENGWAAALETPAGELIVLDYLGGDVLPTPDVVAGFLGRLRRTVFPGRRTPPLLRAGAAADGLASRLARYRAGS